MVLIKLEEFSYEKFRSVKGMISLPIHEISILIGQNGGGKTTTLDALKLFLEPLEKIDIKDINSNISIENLDVIFSSKFQIIDEEKEFFRIYDPSLANDYITIYKKFKVSESESYYFIYTLGTGTDLDNLGLGRFKEPYEELCNKYEIELSSSETVSNMKDKLKIKREEIPSDKQIEKRIPTKDIKTILPTFILLSSEESPDPKKEMIKILINTLKEKVEDLHIEKEVKRIRTVVLGICNQKIEEANDIIKKYCKDIERIDINPEYNALQGLNLDEFNIIKKSGDKVRFESEATGKRKQIMLGIYEWSNLQITEELNENFVIAFDEPDLHFDYFQISNLLNILNDFSKKDNVQVLIATHSIKLIDNFPPNQIVNFTLNNNDETEILFITDEDYEQIGDFLKDLAFSIGFRSSFLFFEKIFVIVEGESEYKAFPILFELINDKTHFEAGILFINAESNVQALSFAKFLRNNKKRAIIVVDKDSKKIKQFKEAGLRKIGFREGTDVFLVGKEPDSEGEFEGEFTSEQWVTMLNNKYPKKNDNEWNPQEIDNIRTRAKLSKELLELIETECIEQVSKPDLVKALSKSIKNKDEISENLKSIILQLNSIANSN